MIAHCKRVLTRVRKPCPSHTVPTLWPILLVIEGLPRNRLADGDAEMLAHILVHLVHEEQHGKIERQMLVAEPGDAIEPF